MALVIFPVRLDQIRFSLNIVVDKQNDVAPCRTNSNISGCGCPTFGLRKCLQIGICARFLIENGLGFIRRIIVDYKNFIKIMA